MLHQRKLGAVKPVVATQFVQSAQSVESVQPVADVNVAQLIKPAQSAESAESTGLQQRADVPAPSGMHTNAKAAVGRTARGKRQHKKDRTMQRPRMAFTQEGPSLEERVNVLAKRADAGKLDIATVPARDLFAFLQRQRRPRDANANSMLK